MKISSEQRSHVTPGKVVNILSTGVARCDRIFMPLCQLCSVFGENFLFLLTSCKLGGPARTGRHIECVYARVNRDVAQMVSARAQHA